MELPSMVQRSGDTLIVRSVVSGNQLYMDQSANQNTSTVAGGSNQNNTAFTAGQALSNALLLETQLERLKTAQHLLQQQQQHHQMQQQHQQQQQQQQHLQQQTTAMELKEEGLPQCKIKRNYSCSYCTYFTQNPRYHLTHLRDVHGEKIVINKCKLCLYASRHYQKLVRHMKMVHGCTDGMAGSHGQARGKRGMNREARKRKLEDNLTSGGAIKHISMDSFNVEQLQSDMEREQHKIQRDLEMFKKQQEEQQKSQQQQQQQQLSVTAAGALFAAAYEQQLRAQQREFEKESSLKNDHSAFEQNQSPSPHKGLEESVAPEKLYNFTQSQGGTCENIEIPPQRPSFELTPSPSGSNSSPPPEPTNSGSTTPLGLSPDEPSNNRLMKCSLCDFTTLYRNNLLEHEIEDHCNAKFYRCEKCSYVTHIKARFSKHVKYHSMPMIKCCTCDFRTPYKWNLDRHMKNHGGAGPFKCAACDFTADIKQSLTVHEMNHHVPPVGHAAGMTLARRRNKVGGTDLSEDFFSDSAEMMEDHFNNNNMDEYDEMIMTAGPAEALYDSKRLRYEEDEPTDLSAKGGSSDTSSVHNLTLPKVKKPLPNLIPIIKEGDSILNLTTEMAGSRSSLSDIASMFFNEKQISEMLHPIDKADAAVGTASQLSPTTTILSSASSRSMLNRKGGSFFDKIKAASTTTNENLICPCGHMAKCLSESIIHRKTCTFSPDDIDLDEDDHDEDGEEGRLEIDFNDDEDCDKQSQSALNLSVTGSTRCQHCRHRCKSSADLLNHLKICSEANSHCDSMSGESCAGSRVMQGDNMGELHHPMENRVFVWNKIPHNQQQEGSQQMDANGQIQQSRTNSSSTGGGSLLSANNDENSYYGVETAPGYGEVTKKMTPEEEAANSSLKKVYKCPHCSFWASTASRFHVHIVGHLNKKPFECSLCSYRSNWRWDITKHIRLKTIRDPSHKNARVLMNDETGRRNYTKYNKYITLMKVTEEDGDPKLMKSGEMTPNQVASLAFINDYNQKQQQGSLPSSSSTPLNNILNGVREDITLEPIPPKSSGICGDESLSDNFIRLPFLASMMNAAMAQQQHQKNHQQSDQEKATLITPSVTISAVKKSPPTTAQTFKPNDEIIVEMRQDGNEKNYKCRKCSFRHSNRDAVLAHVKVHFPDPNMPIVTATATASPSKSHQTSPLQVSVNSNNYVNKVLAAMCMQQQQQPNSNANAQLSSLMAAGLLDQSANSQFSGLALALAGKNPLKVSQLNAAANILEHGEQKASLNEQASADNTTTSPNQLTIQALQQHQQQQTLATSSTSTTYTNNNGYGSSSSLQNLLTSPRGSYVSQQQQQHDVGGADLMVMGSPKTNHLNKMGIMATTPTPTPSPATIRHCRLKHAGVINIETLDRSATGDRHTAPIYKPLVNGAMSEQQQTMAATQQQQLQNINTNSINNNNNIIMNNNITSNNGSYNINLKALQQQQLQNNNVLMDNSNQHSKLSISLPKTDSPSAHALLHSPLAISAAAAASAVNAPHDLQAAAVAYLAAAYKAAAAQSNNSNPSITNALANLPNLTSMAEELLLQQQLQKNDQIEITRVTTASGQQKPSNLNNIMTPIVQMANKNSTSNLAQLLENNSSQTINNGPVAAVSQPNNKSKQQKCPLCTYICDSKSQMNYHISLHKPTQYECHLCTFVCAKKQHLSSHMRTVHQILPNQQQQNHGFAAANVNANLNMDFSMALKMAAAAQSQQDSPLAIDLSNIKPNIPRNSSPAQRHNTNANQPHPQTQNQHSPLPPEYQYRLIYYCNKCPARYAQKHNDPQTAKLDLDDHLKQHENLPSNSSDDMNKYQCEYCDYRAPHETLIQTHRYVHTTQYQEKCNELYKNCKDDTVFRAPKLMHITATRKAQQPETIWVVDNELIEGQSSNSLNMKRDQNSAITSSSQGKAFESGNSLLKKQLESKQTTTSVNSPENNINKINNCPPKDRETLESLNNGENLENEPKPQETVIEEEQQQENEDPTATKERCSYCPFESENASEFKGHIQKHLSVCQNKLAFMCDHCDFTAAEKEEIDDHTQVHFNSMEKLKEVAFFTSYNQLEISMEQPNDEKECENEKDQAEKENTESLNIKKELTALNNNEEDRVNENFKTSQDCQENNEATTTTEGKQPKCAKIILYKNDGCLTIKKENTNDQGNLNSNTNNTTTSPSTSSNSQNISDRLRRRISRQGGGGGGGNGPSASSSNINQTTNPEDQQSTSHKTILVNAKTGQVISRN